jgi:hypothetical protein
VHIIPLRWLEIWQNPENKDFTEVCGILLKNGGKVYIYWTAK